MAGGIIVFLFLAAVATVAVTQVRKELKEPRRSNPVYLKGLRLRRDPNRLRNNSTLLLDHIYQAETGPTLYVPLDAVVQYEPYYWIGECRFGGGSWAYLLRGGLDGEVTWAYLANLTNLGASPEYDKWWASLTAQQRSVALEKIQTSKAHQMKGRRPGGSGLKPYLTPAVLAPLLPGRQSAPQVIHPTVIPGVQCPWCHVQVPPGRACYRCGGPLSQAQ